MSTTTPSGLVVPRAAAGVNPFRSDAINIGPGILWIAPVGTVEPKGVHGGPDALQPPGTGGTSFSDLWIPLGYTSEGSTFSYAIDSSPIEVAESLLPVRTMTTSVTMTMAFALAQLTAVNVSVALNGGVATVPEPDGTATYVEFTPPRAGLEQRVALGWDRDDGLERMILRQCIQTGSVDIARQKAPDYATLPVTFTVEQPPGGVDPLYWALHESIIGGPEAPTGNGGGNGNGDE